jgi:TRAP-type mannitol/chloroaromatic compound transport system permease small subunit
VDAIRHGKFGVSGRQGIMKALNYIGKANEFLVSFFSWFALALAIAEGYEVGMRYFFSAPTFWAYEISWMFYSVIWLMAMGYCEYRGQHVKVDVLFNKLSLRARSFLLLFFYVVAFFPFCVAMIIYTTKYALVSWSLLEGSHLTMWGPPVYPIKTLMVVGFILLTLQGLAGFIRTASVALTGEEGRI